MKNRRLKRFLEKKAFLLVLLLCVVSALGMYGVYRMEIRESNEQDESFSDGLVDLNEMSKEQELSLREEPKTSQKTETEEKVPGSVNSEEPETQGQENDLEEDLEEFQDTDPTLEETMDTAQVLSRNVLDFSQSENIKWPVKGNIILDYSPDNTVYFSTLEQYRCNPAILIQAQQGVEVAACTDGKVKEITTTDELGTTLTLDLGSGYEAVYGQLADVTVTNGATVEAGEILGVVAAPSKYYVVEGSHVYFQMQKDGEPINPRAFLE